MRARVTFECESPARENRRKREHILICGVELGMDASARVGDKCARGYSLRLCNRLLAAGK